LIEYAYDGVNAWGNFSGTGALQSRQLFLPGQDQMLARVNGPSTAAWYLTDHLGSVRNLITYDGSSALDVITYDGFGNITAESNAAQGDSYKYDGYVYDSVIGLYYVRARYYSTLTGRWIQQDPIGFAAGDVDLYRYAGNSPIDRIDPTGDLSFTLNKAARTITMHASIHFDFKNEIKGTKDEHRTPPGQATYEYQRNTRWDSARETRFRSLFKIVTENTFNHTDFVIVPNHTANFYKGKQVGTFPCSVIPLLEITVKLSGSADFDVEVMSNPPPAEGMGSSSGIGGHWFGYDGWWEERDVILVDTPGGNEQIGGVHEFGHLLGLQHPGNPPAYANDPRALMGDGMQMRLQYYQKWVDHLNKAYWEFGPYRTVSSGVRH
jgi:RHS repeat-associated protein